MFEKACNKYALMVIYRCKGKVLTKVKEMTNKQIEKLIEKLESQKTTKSAKTLLNKKGIKTEEGFGKSYSFEINGTKYNVVKNKYDDTCHVNKFRKAHIEKCEPKVVPMCYGRTISITERIVFD